VLVDTFHVALTGPDTTFHHQDTFVCSNDVPFILNGPAGYLAYSWNTGATTPSITASAAGDYFVLALSSCGMLNDTFKVVIIQPPVILLGKDTSFCTGNPITLSSDQPAGYTWLWNTGSTGPSIRVSSPGIYWVRVGNQGCFTTDTINVTLTPPSASGHLTNVTPNETITYGSDIQLNADNEWLYVWKPNDGSLNDPNINDPVDTPLHTTLYTVYGYDHQGCMDSATVVINVDSTMKECVPNSFTPNGDGLNDVFMPICVRFQKMVDLRIYNRWGQMVFFSTSMESGWDGTFNGVPQDMDTYFYMITIARPGGNVIYKGDVTLVR
jgi:gliding motility-associated-like protein